MTKKRLSAWVSRSAYLAALVVAKEDLGRGRREVDHSINQRLEGLFAIDAVGEQQDVGLGRHAVRERLAPG